MSMFANRPHLPEKLHRVRPKCQASSSVYSEESSAVQTVGLRHVALVRVHGLRGYHAQHSLPCHEVLRAAQGLHGGVGRPQYNLHSFFYTGICT